MIIRKKQSRRLPLKAFIEETYNSTEGSNNNLKNLPYNIEYNTILDKLLPLYIIRKVKSKDGNNNNHYLNDIFEMIESTEKDIIQKTRRIQLFKSPFY